MKIEPVEPIKTADLTDKIKSFWSRNVNCERILGTMVSEHSRGTPEYFATLQAQRYRTHRHLLPSIQAMTPGKSVLEIGCGIGLDAYQMANHGLKVTAIDLTDIAVAVVRKRFQDEKLRGEFSTGDATALQFADNSFDYVYSFGVLHHAADTEKSIGEVYRVLKKGGQAKIMLYNRHSLNEFVHRATHIPFEDKDELCPVVRRFSKKDVLRLFAKFEKVDIHLDYAYGEGYGVLFRLTPLSVYKLLSKYLGWHIMISAVK